MRSMVENNFRTGEYLHCRGTWIYIEITALAGVEEFELLLVLWINGFSVNGEFQSGNPTPSVSTNIH